MWSTLSVFLWSQAVCECVFLHRQDKNSASERAIDHVHVYERIEQQPLHGVVGGGREWRVSVCVSVCVRQPKAKQNEIIHERRAALLLHRHDQHTFTQHTKYVRPEYFCAIHRELHATKIRSMYATQPYDIPSKELQHLSCCIQPSLSFHPSCSVSCHTTLYMRCFQFFLSRSFTPAVVMVVVCAALQCWQLRRLHSTPSNINQSPFPLDGV